MGTQWDDTAVQGLLCSWIYIGQMGREDKREQVTDWIKKGKTWNIPAGKWSTRPNRQDGGILKQWGCILFVYVGGPELVLTRIEETLVWCQPHDQIFKYASVKKLSDKLLQKQKTASPSLIFFLSFFFNFTLILLQQQRIEVGTSTQWGAFQHLARALPPHFDLWSKWRIFIDESSVMVVLQLLMFI